MTHETIPGTTTKEVNLPPSLSSAIEEIKKWDSLQELAKKVQFHSDNYISTNFCDDNATRNEVILLKSHLLLILNTLSECGTTEIKEN